MQDRKFEKTRLNDNERPRYFYHYTVTGTGTFPFDMLRYDQAWPMDPHGVKHSPERRSIEIRSYHEPTRDRWDSFGWIVNFVGI